ncbi:MAG: hypothetical protein ACJ8F3_22210 [Xanthobacteraceae bacterium]
MSRKAFGKLAAGLAATVILLLPALWNRFPLLQYDTGGYFARWYEGTLEVSRSTVYGLFLVALARPDFWPVIAVQAALTVWVIALVLREQKLGDHALVLVVTIALLAAATSVAWLASLLLTDIFAGIGVLALYLIVLRAASLARWERAALFIVVGFAAATHSATLAVLAGLLVIAALLALLRPGTLPLAGLGRGAAALGLGAVMLVSANYVVAGRVAWTPGGIALLFGRMLQDGIVARYLAEHCPDPRFQLCQHRDELPTDADVYFWGKSVFDRLGRFEGLNDEMRTIVLESMAAYPVWQIEAALEASLYQLVKVQTGEGVLDSIWHTYGMLERFAPASLPDMRAARQQNGGLDWKGINAVHVPVALASMVALLGVIALAGRAPHLAPIAPLAVTVALTLFGNALVCGALANPHDRYGSRIVWIATLVVMLAGWHWRESAGTHPST